jgi:hypothetical protein
VAIAASSSRRPHFHSSASAQNWSFDARNVGLGGVGSTSNVAVDMIDEQRPYRPLVLPRSA